MTLDSGTLLHCNPFHTFKCTKVYTSKKRMKDEVHVYSNEQPVNDNNVGGVVIVRDRI